MNLGDFGRNFLENSQKADAAIHAMRFRLILLLLLEGEHVRLGATVEQLQMTFSQLENRLDRWCYRNARIGVVC